ncbi:hypothetical protein BGX26_007397, partial [Mortierella sp. AD094]
MQYEKSRRSMEERIRTHPSLEEEEYDQYRREHQHHVNAPQSQNNNSQNYRIARRSSQPSYMTDHRGKLPSLLNSEGQDQDYKDPEIKKLVFADQTIPAPRRGSGGSTKIAPPSAPGIMQTSSTGSSTPSSRNGKREVTTGGMVT